MKQKPRTAMIVIAVLAITWSTPALAKCSFGKGLACFFPISTCVLSIDRNAILQCVQTLTNGYCTQCITDTGLDPRDRGATDQTLKATGQFLSVVRTLSLTGRAVAPNQDGRLELVSVHSNKHPFHIWQQPGAGLWSGPSGFEGAPAVSSFVTVVQRGDGPLEIYAVQADGAVGTAAQLAPNVNWSDWKSVGGNFKGPVVAALRPNGSLALAGVTTSGGMAYARDEMIGRRWSQLGGSWSGTPAIACNQDGRLEIFAVNSAGILQHKWELAFGGDWSDWSTLGEGYRPGLAVTRAIDGRLAVFASTSTGGLHLIMQRAANLDWDAAIDLGGTHLGTPSVALNADGTMEVFVRGVEDRAIYRNSQQTIGSGFSGWESLGGSVNSSPVVAMNNNGELEIFAVGFDRAIWHRRRVGGGPDWTPWESLGGSVRAELF